MIVFMYSPFGIAVMRTKSQGQKPEGIGRFLPDSYGQRFNWLWDQRKTDLETYRTLNDEEKRNIIGMMDALNGLPVRSISDIERRWEEIIGPIVTRQLEILLDITREQ